MSQNLSHIWHLWEFNAGLDRLIGVRSTRIPWNKDLNLTHCHQDSEPENRQKKTLAHIVQAITNKQPMNTSKPCLDQSHLTVYLNKVQPFTKREKNLDNVLKWVSYLIHRHMVFGHTNYPKHGKTSIIWCICVSKSCVVNEITLNTGIMNNATSNHEQCN